MRTTLIAVSRVAVLLLGATYYSQNATGRVELYRSQKAALAAELERMRRRTEQAGEAGRRDPRGRPRLLLRHQRPVLSGRPLPVG